MSRWIAGFIIISSMLGTTSAYAQETTAGPGTVEVTIVPGGMTFFTKDTKSGSPAFDNYHLGGAVAYNFNQTVGVEGEFGGSLGLNQLMTGFTVKEKTPNMLSYTGNVVFNASGHSAVPYVTGGIGALTVNSRPALGVMTNDTFLTTNVGGGIKWFAADGRWGLRGDYRFEGLRSNLTASSFVGPNARYANRIYGAVIINAVK